MRNLLLTGSAILCCTSLLILGILVTNLGRAIPAEHATAITGCWIFGILAVVTGILAVSSWRMK